MTDRQIIFSGPMVRAILAGRKTQHRVPLKPQPHPHAHVFEDGGYWYAETKLGPGPDCIGVEAVDPVYAPGDRLWVRETWAHWHRGDATPGGNPYDPVIQYRADDDQPPSSGIPLWEPFRFRSPLHMPRKFSRLTLTVTNVRVQRAQEISPRDVLCEGADVPEYNRGGLNDSHRWAPDHFRTLWDSLNAKRGYGWDANPWVSVIHFRTERRNIDQMEAA